MIHNIINKIKHRIYLLPYISSGSMPNVGIDKDKISRDIVFSNHGRFLDVGGGDGKLRYLLGVNNGRFSQKRYNLNKSLFDTRYLYSNFQGDICAEINQSAEFDIIYSNNVFEHLPNPFKAVENIYKLLKAGGYCITIAPFSWRYHEVPSDYFRYTHNAIPYMFGLVGDVDIIISGYDKNARRRYGQGTGQYNDKVAGLLGWRENWQTVTIIRKK